MIIQIGLHDDGVLGNYTFDCYIILLLLWCMHVQLDFLRALRLDKGLIQNEQNGSHIWGKRALRGGWHTGVSTMWN